MQTQRTTNPLHILVMLSMVFCVVFAPSLKSALDSVSLTKKVTTQQLLEEEANEKESKLGKEVYSKHNFSLYPQPINEHSILLSSKFHSPLKITKPYLKVHTPPPDHLL